MGKIKDGKLLYHLTKLSNLDSIIEKGLVSRKILIDNRYRFDDVADPEIMTKRTELGLDKYIPFHFHPHSSFDVAVKNSCNDEFVYICINRKIAKENDFKIIIRHPLNQSEMKLFDYEEGFNNIDWEAMESSSTAGKYEREVRMAECITDKDITANFFASIAVANENTKKIVEQKLKSHGISKPPYVDVQPWLGTDSRNAW